MKVSVIGNGGREHALRHGLAKTSTMVEEPTEADLVVIGPETPLVDGLADDLRAKGLLVYGPGASGARLEGSKQYMKDFVARAGVPTARYKSVTSIEEAEDFFDSLTTGFVIKTDGLAAGKGVLVTTDRSEASQDVKEKLSGSSFGDAGRKVVIEELMTGPEVSVMFVFDGKRGMVLPPAQDFKRALDHDKGPNTGGMGAYSPVPLMSDTLMQAINDNVLVPTAEQLQREKIDYRGTLYAGLMITADGPRLVEYNVRFGDPETQVIVPLLDGDFAGLLSSAASGSIDESQVQVTTRCAVTVTLASAGYPESSRKGDVISGINSANELPGVTVYEAGVARDDNGVVTTNGGRVLNVTAVGDSLNGARAAAYEAVNLISFDGMHYRSDIALAAANKTALPGNAPQGDSE